MRPGEKAHPRESPPPAPDPTEENVSSPGNRPAPPNAALGRIGLRRRSAKKRMIRAAYRPSPTSEVGKISSRQDDGTSGRARRMRCSAARSARTMPLCPPHCPPPFRTECRPHPAPSEQKRFGRTVPGAYLCFSERARTDGRPALPPHSQNTGKTYPEKRRTGGLRPRERRFRRLPFLFAQKKKRHFAR